jgi:hypothetical protein
MLQGLGSYISQALAENQENLLRNPQISAQLQAKISMLQRPTLHNEIIDRRFWVESNVASISGRTMQIVAVFPLESMRADATQAVQRLERSLPILENFMQTVFPAGSVRVWYGFIIGNKGGGGAIFTEDKETYESRWRPPMVPFDPILGHELSHSYIGHEGLTQFLELYVYNMVQTSSPDVQSWVFTRDYVPLRPANEGVAALLDVYGLLGHDRMSNAYKAAYSLRPPFGQPLPDPVKQVFIDHASADARSEVAEIMARVVY